VRGSASELTSVEPGGLGMVEAAFKTGFVKGSDLSHLFGRECEVEKFGVAGDTRGSDGLGDHDGRSLDSPAEEDVRSRFTLGLCDLLDDSIVHERLRSVMV